MATEHEVSMLVAALVRATQPEFVLEIGTHTGVTTARIAEAIAANEHGRFVSLEIDPQVHEQAALRCAGMAVELVLGDSLSYAPPQPVDFVFVDGSIERAADVEHIVPHLADKALVVVHDMAGPHRPQRDRIVPMLGREHVLLDTPRGLLIAMYRRVAP